MGIGSTKEAGHWAVLTLIFLAGMLAGMAVLRTYSSGSLSDLEKVSREVEALQEDIHQIASVRNISGQGQAAEILKRHLASFSPNERSILAALAKQMQAPSSEKPVLKPVYAPLR